MESDQTNKRWIDLPAVPFDLEKTLQSGQVFHWKLEMGLCRGLVGEEVLTLRRGQEGWQVPTKRSLELAIRYFSLDHPLENIWSTFPDDAFSQAALESCRGLRLIRQPQWECLATFITSPLKQVAHISQMSLSLRKKYGTPVRGGWAYPPAEVIASLKEEDLRACGLGFRARGLLGTARAVATGKLDLEALKDMETPRAFEALMQAPGVGEKVAHCVLLFAYERLEVVPVDVWIGRVLLQMRRGRRGKPAQLQKYSQRRFGPYAGYVQQYLFHHARTASGSLRSRELGK
ncbi:MAG: hypothetical protein C5B47_03400 [Verrucomicrobia bacterium]|nr:MAG: hypothetical protein C5B47_03400 [Verrucomicrobiota bacterium]